MVIIYITLYYSILPYLMGSNYINRLEGEEQSLALFQFQLVL